MMKKFAAGMAALAVASLDVWACTVTLVTKGASADGSVLVSHSNDGFTTDPDFVFVPAKDHPEGSMRPVYPTAVALDAMPEYDAFCQPQLVAPEKCDGYDFPGRPHTKPLGYIPEVAHTYAYIDGNYGVVNEHGLMFGECTDMSDWLPELPYREGGGIFYSTELSRVALERCKTAREAIALMGSLIDEYGLWGTAETLLVADREEGWIFEMQMVPGGKGGLWIAERIPDGEFCIAANQLRIRAIREGDPDQMFNPRLPQMLKDLHWEAYDEDGRLDWVRSLQAREFHHPYYSKRRVWRGLDAVAPSRKFPPRVESWDSKAYPLSVRPDRKLGVQDITRLYRDYLQGTEFDKSESPLSGPFGSPYHYVKEQGERSILSAKTAFSFVVQVREDLPSPVVWLSTGTPAENPFVPFALAEMPEPWSHALRDTYDASKMWWAANQVMALDLACFTVMHPIIAEAVQRSEEASLRLVEASRGLDPEAFAQALSDNAVRTFEDWKALGGRLLQKFDGGCGVQYKHCPIPDTPTEY